MSTVSTAAEEPRPGLTPGSSRQSPTTPTTLPPLRRARVWARRSGSAKPRTTEATRKTPRLTLGNWATVIAARLSVAKDPPKDGERPVLDEVRPPGRRVTRRGSSKIGYRHDSDVPFSW